MLIISTCYKVAAELSPLLISAYTSFRTQTIKGQVFLSDKSLTLLSVIGINFVLKQYEIKHFLAINP